MDQLSSPSLRTRTNSSSLLCSMSTLHPREPTDHLPDKEAPFPLLFRQSLFLAVVVPFHPTTCCPPWTRFVLELFLLLLTTPSPPVSLLFDRLTALLTFVHLFSLLYRNSALCAQRIEDR